MEKTLNFITDFNNKFINDYFTTIRSPKTVEEKHLEVGDRVDILYLGVRQFSAMVVGIDAIKLDHNLSPLQRTLLMLDTGAHWLEALRIVESYCKSNVVVIITLKNLS